MKETGKSVFIIIAVALVAFLAGFGWQYLRAQELAGRLEAAEREASFTRLGVTLAATTIEAERGGYERARQLASDFFSGLQAAIDRATPETRPALDEILGQRDATITALSRSNPESSDMLSRMFTSYRLALGDSVGPTVETGTIPSADTGIVVPPPDTGAVVPPADTTAVMPPADTATDTLVTTTTGR